MSNLPPDELNGYYEIANRSAARGRVVIYLLVIASTIGLLVAAQSGELNWMWARMDSAACAVKYWKYVEKTRGPKQSEKPDLRLENVLKNPQYIPIEDDIGNKVEGDVAIRDLKRGRALSEARSLISLTQAESHLEEQRRAFGDHMLAINIPIIGLVVDVNNMGPLIGLVIVILLIMFRLTLAKDLEILRLVKRKCGRDQLEQSYYQLSLAHVLIRPGSEYVPFKRGFWAVIPKMFVYLPLVSYSLLVVDDIFTSPRASMHSERMLRTSNYAEGILWIFALILTWYIVVDELRETDEEWKDWYKSLLKLEAKKH